MTLVPLAAFYYKQITLFRQFDFGVIDPMSGPQHVLHPFGHNQPGETPERAPGIFWYLFRVQIRRFSLGIY